MKRGREFFQSFPAGTPCNPAAVELAAGGGVSGGAAAAAAAAAAAVLVCR